MTRSEIIELTIERLGIEDNYQADTSDFVHFEDFLDSVIATIAQQLPDGEIETCEDLNLSVACCTACHNYLPHLGMKLVTLPDGCKAWLCCRLRSALLEPNAATIINRKVAADKAASIIASAEAMSDQDAGRRAYDLLHLDHEMSPEENVECCALMCMPTKFYIE
jgi:hypothetical protein